MWRLKDVTFGKDFRDYSSKYIIDAQTAAQADAWSKDAEEPAELQYLHCAD